MDKTDVLRLTDKGLDVFKHYSPFPFRIGRNFLNPLYKDSKASCNIYFDRRGEVYKMKDFGNDDYSGDCFTLIGKLNNLNCKVPKDFMKIMEIINGDLHLGHLKASFFGKVESSVYSLPLVYISCLNIVFLFSNL